MTNDSHQQNLRVVNAANVPCNGRWPCSPEGKWKGALGSGDRRGSGRECPFEGEGFLHSPTMSLHQYPLRPLLGWRAQVLDWSDTTTFLFGAELSREMFSDRVQVSYPVTFDQTVHFTVPADAKGVCIEVDLNRDHIVFPLGPEPRLSCTALVNPDHTKFYRCELKALRSQMNRLCDFDLSERPQHHFAAQH